MPDVADDAVEVTKDLGDQVLVVEAVVVEASLVMGALQDASVLQTETKLIRLP